MFYVLVTVFAAVGCDARCKADPGRQLWIDSIGRLGGKRKADSKSGGTLKHENRLVSLAPDSQTELQDTQVQPLGSEIPISGAEAPDAKFEPLRVGDPDAVDLEDVRERVSLLVAFANVGFPGVPPALLQQRTCCSRSLLLMIGATFADTANPVTATVTHALRLASMSGSSEEKCQWPLCVDRVLQLLCC